MHINMNRLIIPECDGIWNNIYIKHQINYYLIINFQLSLFSYIYQIIIGQTKKLLPITLIFNIQYYNIIIYLHCNDIILQF